MNYPSCSLNFSFYGGKPASETDSGKTNSVLDSMNSMNSSRFEEVKYLRKQRDDEVLKKM